MLNIDGLRPEVLNAVIQNMGYDIDAEVPQRVYDEIKLMSRTECFERYLNWVGIFGYTESILQVVDNIDACVTKLG